MKLSRANQKADAGKLFTGEMSRKFTDVRARLARLVEINEQGAKEATQGAAASYGAARLITVWHARCRPADRDRRDGVQLLRHRASDRPHHRTMGVLAGGDTQGRRSRCGAPRRDRPTWLPPCRCSGTTWRAARDARSQQAAEAAERATPPSANPTCKNSPIHSRRLSAQYRRTVSSASTELEAAAGTLTHTAEMTQQMSGTVAAASEAGFGKRGGRRRGGGRDGDIG